MGPERTVLLPRVAGATGIASQIAAGTTIVAAIVCSPWFSWTENELSILGVEGPATGLVRWGFIAAGLLNLPFVLRLAKDLPQNPLTRSGTWCLALGSLTLAGAGIFPRSMDLPHDISSIAFFVLVTMALVVIGIGATAAYRMAWGLVTLTAGVLMAIIQCVPWPWSGGAIPQVLAVLPWSVWTLVNGAFFVLGRRWLGVPE